MNVENKRKEYEKVLVTLKNAANDVERSAAPKQRRNFRAKPPCFETAVALMKKKPNLSLVQFCREMDSNAEKFRSAVKYRPPESWYVPTFHAQYQKRSNTVSRFVSAVRSEIARRADEEM